jgi:hypothetical protein
MRKCGHLPNDKLIRQARLDLRLNCVVNGPDRQVTLTLETLADESEQGKARAVEGIGVSSSPKSLFLPILAHAPD